MSKGDKSEKPEFNDSAEKNLTDEYLEAHIADSETAASQEQLTEDPESHYIKVLPSDVVTQEILSEDVNDGQNLNITATTSKTCDDPKVLKKENKENGLTVLNISQTSVSAISLQTVVDLSKHSSKRGADGSPRHEVKQKTGAQPRYIRIKTTKSQATKCDSLISVPPGQQEKEKIACKHKRSAASSTSEDSELEESYSAKKSKLEHQQATVKKKKQVNRCGVCKTKLGLCAIQCRCGNFYCPKHRYDREHDCTFDYRALGSEEIRRNNPRIIAEKIRKL